MGMTIIDVATYYGYYDGAVPEREEQAASDRKLSKADKTSSCVVDSTAWSLTLNVKSQAPDASTPRQIYTLPDVIRIKCYGEGIAR